MDNGRVHTSVGWLIEHQRAVKWQCEVAPVGHSGEVDLHAIAKAKGGGFSLANRRPRCKIPGCPGRVRFMDRSTQWGRALDTITDGHDAYWTYRDEMRQRMADAGWQMEGGYWVSPDRIEHR